MMKQGYPRRLRHPMILALSLCCLLVPTCIESFEFGPNHHAQQLRSKYRLGVKKYYNAVLSNSAGTGGLASGEEAAVRIQHKRSDGTSGGGHLVGKRGADGGFLTFQKAPAKLVEARQHGQTVLECSAAGSPAPSLTWYKNGQPLVKVPEIVLYPGLSSNQVQEQEIQNKNSLAVTHAKLELDCVTENDAGFYECVASQGEKTETVATEVRVASYGGGQPCQPKSMSSCPPMISQHYQTYMLEMGYDAHLKCVTIGRHLTIWLGPDEQPITDNDKFKIMPDGSLIIHDLDFSDMGAYVCVAKNKYGHAMAETFVYPVAPMF